MVQSHTTGLKSYYITFNINNITYIIRGIVKNKKIIFLIVEPI